ncbi:MAG: response regulator [Hahellaceae bacterium]|nr:response regulator [Hahellaceae bacterium]
MDVPPLDRAPVHILSIDDNPNNQKIIRQSLSQDYCVQCIYTCEDALNAILDQVPDIILLDVSLPDGNGYALCKQLRQQAHLRTTPILFISALTSLEDRLQGFAAGGDDYLCKPILPKELRARISVTLQRMQTQEKLLTELHEASHTAYSAIVSMGETGQVLNFLTESFQVNTYQALGQLCLDFLASFDLNGSLQIRALTSPLTLSHQKNLKPLELELLALGAQAERILSVSSRTLFNTDHLTLLVKNMPVSDEALYGRLKDHLALMLKGANARMQSLRLEEARRNERESKVRYGFDELKSQLSELDHYFLQLEQNLGETMDHLFINMEQEMLAAGLTEAQEERLLHTLANGRARMDALRDIKSDMQQHFIKLEAAFIEVTLEE